MVSALTSSFPKIELGKQHQFSIPKWNDTQDYYYVGTHIYSNPDEIINEAYRLSRLLGLSLTVVDEDDENLLFYCSDQKDSLILLSLLCGRGDADMTFNLDLERHVVDWKAFKRNFDVHCLNNNIKASFSMDTVYIRRIRVETNNIDNAVIIMRLHEQGAFNVGMHHKAIQILPAFKT